VALMRPSQKGSIIMAKHNKNPQAPPEVKNEVATRGETSVATPADLSAMLMEDEGAGREGMGARDLAIPRLSILQALSPVCTKGDPAYIKEAEVGEIYDNIQGKRFNGETGLVVIPVTYRRTYIEWAARNFVADHGNDESIMAKTVLNEKKQSVLPSGNFVVETAEYYCIVLDPETGLPRQAVISMSRTQFKKAKLWNSLMSNLMVPRPDGNGAFNPAIFYQSYLLTTVPESNDQGSWYGWKIQSYKPTLELVGGNDLYIGSRSFRKSVQAGEVKVAEHDGDAIVGAQPGDIDGDSI
jgi:hypothetical protein